METRRWLNQYQPQTLVNATILLYIRAVFAVIFFRGIATGPFFLLTLAPFVGAAGAYGIANDRKWGYWLAVGAAVVPLAFTALFVVISPSILGDVRFLINLLFDVVLAVLLLHPMSREYQRIWFK